MEGVPALEGLLGQPGMDALFNLFNTLIFHSFFIRIVLATYLRPTAHLRLQRQKRAASWARRRVVVCGTQPRRSRWNIMLSLLGYSLFPTDEIPIPVRFTDEKKKFTRRGRWPTTWRTRPTIKTPGPAVASPSWSHPPMRLIVLSLHIEQRSTVRATPRSRISLRESAGRCGASPLTRR